MSKKNETSNSESEWQNDSEIEWSWKSGPEWSRPGDPETFEADAGHPNQTSVGVGAQGQTGPNNTTGADPLPTIPLTHELVREMWEVHGPYIMSRLEKEGAQPADAENGLASGALCLLNAIERRNKRGLPPLMVTAPKLYLLQSARHAHVVEAKRYSPELTLTKERWQTEVEWAFSSSEWEHDVVSRCFVDAILAKAKLGKREAEQVDLVVQGHTGRGANGEGAPANDRKNKERGLRKVRSVLTNFAT